MRGAHSAVAKCCIGVCSHSLSKMDLFSGCCATLPQASLCARESRTPGQRHHARRSFLWNVTSRTRAMFLASHFNSHNTPSELVILFGRDFVCEMLGSHGCCPCSVDQNALAFEVVICYSQSLVPLWHDGGHLGQ